MNEEQNQILAEALYDIQVNHIPIPPIEVVAAPKTTGETLGFFRLGDARVFRDIVRSLASIVEEVTFEGSVEGIHARHMDPSHVALLDVTLPQSEFEKFEFVTVPEKPIRFTARAEDLLKRFKKIRKMDGLVCQVNSDALLVTIGGTTEGIHLLDKSDPSIPLPKLTYSAKAVFERKALVEILQKMAEAGDHVRLTATKEGVHFYSKDDSSFAEKMVDKSGTELLALDLEGDQAKSFYCIEYILAILKSTSADTVTVEYSSNMPVRLRTSLGDHGILEFYLAPRIYDDEPVKKTEEPQLAPAAENPAPTEPVEQQQEQTAAVASSQEEAPQEEEEKPKKKRGRRPKKKDV